MNREQGERFSRDVAILSQYNHLPPDAILCQHSMHCGYCDKGYYSLFAGQKHEIRCERDQRYKERKARRNKK
jgi:hypothetical protein